MSIGEVLGAHTSKELSEWMAYFMVREATDSPSAGSTPTTMGAERRQQAEGSVADLDRLFGRA